MKRTLLFALAVATLAPVGASRAQDSRDQTAASRAYYNRDQLDNLVAPIALYPDPILAQVLISATYADQLELAAQYVRANGTRGLDTQSWDVSVRSVAHYPPVLNMLTDRDDWTTALGQAYAAQSGDVMDAVQRLREMAREQGNLQSSPEQNVIVEPREIRIVPARPTVIYVPTYDPEIVYYRPVFGFGVRSAHWSFGIGFPIGDWLAYDCDWYGRTVYYDGWVGGGWRVASYPYIHVSNYYVYPRPRVVYVNNNVWHRSVSYGNFGRYNTVHRTVDWNRRDGHAPGPIAHDNGGYRNDGPGRDNRGAQGRDDNRGDNRGAQGRDDNRGDNRGAQGRDDNRGAQGRDDNRSAQPRNRSATVEREAQPNRPVERQAPPTRSFERPAPQSRPVERQAPPSRSIERQAPPSRSVERQAPPSRSVERQAPPSRSEARQAPPSRSVERQAPSRSSSPPSKGSDSHGSSGSSRGGDSRSHRG